MCYNITNTRGCEFYVGGACPDSKRYAIPKYTKFIDIFNTNLAAQFNALKTAFEGQTIFDSLQLQITRKGAPAPELVVQDAAFKKNFDCFKNAVEQSAGAYVKYCSKYENIVYMKLKEASEQQINVVPRRGLEVTDPVFGQKQGSMKVNRKMSTVRK